MNFSGRYRDLIKPDMLHALSVSPLLNKLETSRGGIGANISYNMALLGEQPILLGSVGADAQMYIDDLKQVGVDVSHVHFSDRPTASFNVITDSEDSQVGGFYAGAMNDSDSLRFAPWQGQNVLAMVCAHDPAGMNQQVAECQTSGIRLAYDPGQQVIDAVTDLGAGIQAAELLFVNDYELSLLCQKTGQSAEEIKAKVPLVITTLGGNGSLIEGTKVASPIKVGIAQVVPVDPTGAGDAYRAGFLYGYLRQWDLQKCGQLGATLASFIIEHHGTQYPFNKTEIAARYRDNFSEEMEL